MQVWPLVFFNKNYEKKFNEDLEKIQKTRIGFVKKAFKILSHAAKRCLSI